MEKGKKIKVCFNQSNNVLNMKYTRFGSIFSEHHRDQLADNLRIHMSLYVDISVEIVFFVKRMCNCSGPTGARKMKKIQKTEATLVEARSVEEDFEVYNMKDQANSSLSEVEKVVSKATMQSTSVEMPPELCVVLKFSAAIVRSAYWLPSVMHRIKSVVLASQLRRSIDAPKIPVMEVLCFLCLSLNIKLF